MDSCPLPIVQMETLRSREAQSQDLGLLPDTLTFPPASELGSCLNQLNGWVETTQQRQSWRGRMFLLRPSDGPRVWGLPSWAPHKAVLTPCPPLSLVQPSPGFRTPPGPWQGSLEPGPSPGSCPTARIEPLWPPHRPPSARAWQSPVGLAGRAPGLASRGLAPPEGLWPGNR